MKKCRVKRISRSFLSLLLAVLLAFQETEPLFVQAADLVENTPREVDFSRPDAIGSLEEAGVEEAADQRTADQRTDDSQETNTDQEATRTAQAEEERSEEDPPAAQPEGENQTTDTEEGSTEIALKEPAEYYPLPEEPEGELVDYDEQSRTYKTGDKQYTTVFGGYVGTYKDDKGEIQLVDNTLEDASQEGRAKARKARNRSLATEAAEGASYQNKANDYTINLPKNITKDAGVVIEKEGYRLEIVPLAGDYSHSVVKDNAILYNQVYDGVDVQYTILDTNIKEDIVLNKKTEQSNFDYELRIPGMKAELIENQVYIYPEDKKPEDARYILNAPVMEDAAGEMSFHITLELKEEEEKRILSVKPDQDWLASEERQYPVRIDPSTVNIGSNAFNMNGVEEGSPNSYIGDNDYPYVGYDDGIKSCNLADFGKMHMICRTYIKVNTDFSVIPKDSKIDKATFSVSQKTAYSNGKSQFGLYRVDESWNVPLKWTNQPYKHTFIDVQNASASKNTYINYNVKDLVNDWIQGNYANNGMVLKAIDEANGQTAAMQCEVLNNRMTAYGPKITIEWSPAEDPYLRDMSLDDTTVILRPMTEKSLNGKLNFDAVFADGVARSRSVVEYYLLPDQEAAEKHLLTDAKPLYTYPDSTEYNKLFPEANKYYSKDSNWQSVLYAELKNDTLYQIKARAHKEDENGKLTTGREVSSDKFVIYEVKQFDTLPKIARYYKVPLADLMKDNQVQDALAVAKNTLFIRNPQTNVPYNPPALTDIDKMKIDGALLGRGLHCEFGFEPVNLNTGNFYMDSQDASMNELGGELGITRSYNSKGGGRNSLFGRGWSFNYDQSLAQMEDGSILYMRGDGSYLFFTKNEDGSYQTPAGYEYALKPVSYEDTDHDEISWEITDAAGNVWSFDKYGMLRFVTDVDGFQTKLDYDEDYNLRKILTPSGKEFGITQNDHGCITGITLPDGNKLSYSYDGEGNLTSYTNAAGGIRSYAYDENGRMTSWTDENGNTVVQNTYDEEGRVISQTDACGNTADFAYSEGKTVTTDNEGNKAAYIYDDQYRTTQIIYPDKTRCLKTYDEENHLVKEVTAAGTRTYTYDRFGNIASETREDGATASYSYNEQNKPEAVTDFNGAVTSYEYDGAGDPVAVTWPDGSRTTYGYDELHRLISQTDGRGVTTAYAYEGPNLKSYVDGEGNTWGFGYDAMNRNTTFTDPLGNKTAIGYDANGRQVSVTAGDGGTTFYELDGVGNILSIKDAMGNTTSFTYDKMYNIRKATDPEGHSASYKYNKNYLEIEEADAEGRTITYTRDAVGRVTKEENADFGTRLYAYDAAGRLKQMTDGNGNATAYEYSPLGLLIKETDALGNVTQYGYDALGNETEVLYPDGGSTKTSYDLMGRIVQETSELGAVLSYTYDANGNLLTKSDDSGRTYTYAYDKNNQCISETSPEGGVTAYTYDAAGRLVSSTDAEGRTETYTYDGAGRLTGTKDALGGVTSSEYDLNGNLIRSTDAEGASSSYTYNGIGKMTSVTDPLGNITAMKYHSTDRLAETMDALKGKTTYEYDSMGNAQKITDAGGNEYLFTYDKNGNNTKVTGPLDTSITRKFDAKDQLISEKDAQGLKVSYEYDACGRVAKQKDNAGNSMAYTYDPAGNLTSQTDQLGRTVTYTYDPYGRLLKIKEADGSVTAYEYDVMDRIVAVTDAEGTRTQFAYDKVGNQVSMTEADEAAYQYAYDKLNRVVQATDPLGARKQYEYDAAGNVTGSTDENGTKTGYTYDANGNLTAVVDGNGNTTTYGYDELNRLIKETSPLEEVREYRYDAMGNLTKFKDPMELITEYQYDALGNLTAEISPKGKTTAYTYDRHGNVLTQTDPKGNVTTYERNLNDQVTKLIQANEGVYSYEYDEGNRLGSITTPLGFTTTFAYDVSDNVIKQSNSLKQTMTFTYDKLHRLTGSVDVKGGASSYTYDIRDNLTSETNALGQTSTYTYDVAGRMTERKDPLGQVTTLLYDPAGNLTEAVAPGGRKTSFGYDGNYNLTGVTDPMGYVTFYEYDKSNRLTGVTDPLGQKESYQYDKDGRVTKETDKAGKSTAYAYDPHGNVKMITDKTGLNTHFTYDANDNLKSVTDAAGGKTTYGYDSMNWLTSYTSALGKVTEYTYDLEGNLTSRKDASGRVENMQYDEAGRLVSHISAGGKKTAYDYDELNSLVKKSYEDAKGKKTEDDVLYGYDAMGQRISMKDAIGDASYEYDALGRITKATDSAGQTVTYAYDESGNLQKIGYPDGSEVLYAYDLNDNLIKVTDRQGSVTEYRYDALNRMVQTLRPNELVTDVAYDAMDHITKLVTYCKGCDEVISTYEYTYNEQGFITGETTTESLAGYTYDENWQLTKCTEKEENKGTTTYEYQYDADGNRTRYIKTTAGKTVESVTYKYNDANQLISRTDDKAKKNRTTTYQYDKDGNLVSESSGKKNTITYEYTAENRLKAVSTSKEVLLAALYDGDGNKLFQMDYVEDSKETQKGSVLIPESAKTEKGNSPAEQLAALVPKKNQEQNYTITQYVNDVNRENAEVLMELKVDGTTKAAYTYGEQRLGRDTAGGAFYYLYDGQGSVAGLTSSDGTMKNSYRYDPYGELTFGEPDGINYYGYNGESTNTNTGLQYLRARYYDSENGNFTSEDSWAGYLDLPLSRNRYAYTMNNPVNYTDPSGHRVPTPSAAGSRSTTTRRVTSGGPTAGGMTKPAGSTKGGKVSSPKTNTASIVRNVVTKNQTTKRMYSRMSTTGGPSTGGPQSNGRNNQSTYTSYQNYIAQSKARTQRLVKRELCTPDTERISDGNIKVARGLSVAAAGTSIVFAVVASGGTMLVPILIGATMAVIGAADATEGGLDIWYGRTNPSKESSNLVKEYAFNGNDDWYEATINALMATTLWSGAYVNGLNPDRSGPVSNLSDRAQVGTLEGNSEAASHKTLIRGDEWYRYFQDTYGAENVKWEANSFEEIVRHPTSLNGYTADEVANILGSGWTKSTYGSNGSGWKFIEDAHPDNMVFYHGGGGIHEGSYYGFSSGKYGTVKVVDTNTYVPLPGDKAYIIYSEDH